MRLWKRDVLANFKVLSQSLPRGSEENHEQDSDSRGMCYSLIYCIGESKNVV